MGQVNEIYLFLNQRGKIYRAFKISQHANEDITIVPKSAVLLPRDAYAEMGIGEEFVISVKSLSTKVHHYSAHALTGQRHIKETPLSLAKEPLIGGKIKGISSLVPLVTCVIPTSDANNESTTKGKWFGLNLADDVNYAVIDVYAIPKGVSLGMQYAGLHVNNDHMSQDTYGTYSIEMRNCVVVLMVRTTNHELTDIVDSIFLQQGEGKTIAISRVEKGRVLATVMELSVAQGLDSVIVAGSRVK